LDDDQSTPPSVSSVPSAKEVRGLTTHGSVLAEQGVSGPYYDCAAFDVNVQSTCPMEEMEFEDPCFAVGCEETVLMDVDEHSPSPMRVPLN
jgi:hypothetical protein